MRRSSSKGFTLVEMATALAVILFTGGMLFSAVRNVMLLGAKNGAVNVTHQRTREVIHKAVQQLHSSISIPSLANTSLTAVTGNGPAAAVTYQTLWMGPCKISTTATSGQNVVRILSRAGDPAPVAGMRLNIPAFRIEEDITLVTNRGGSPAQYDLKLANNIASTITISGTPAPNYVTYVTQKSALAVVNGELRHYPLVAAGTYSVVSSDVSTPTPFSVPDGNNRFIQANFATLDARVTGLNLKSMDTGMIFTVPYRYRLTTKQ